MCKTAWMTICWIGKKEMKEKPHEYRSENKR